MSDSTVDTLEKRLERVERELRWWRVGALGAVVLLLSVGAAPRGPTLEAERLVIRDAKGTARAVLGTESVHRGWPRISVFAPGEPQESTPQKGFGLYLYTEAGIEAAHFNLTDGLPDLELTDQQQQAFAQIFVGGGWAHLSLSRNEKGQAAFGAEVEAQLKGAGREKWSKDDKRWQERAPQNAGESLSLYATPAGYGIDGESNLGKAKAYLSPTGWTVINEAASTAGAYSAGFSPWGVNVQNRGDRSELLAGSLEVDGESDKTKVYPGIFNLQDKAGKTRLVLGLHDDASPSIELLDKDSQARAILGQSTLERTKTGDVEQRAESSLVLFDKDGKVLWRAP
jgi:hypothetical protein